MGAVNSPDESPGSASALTRLDPVPRNQLKKRIVNLRMTAFGLSRQQLWSTRIVPDDRSASPARQVSCALLAFLIPLLMSYCLNQTTQQKLQLEN